MNTAVAESLTFEDYLDLCRGQDVLMFDSDEQALEAARELRRRVPKGISVECRYTKVLIRRSK